MSDGEDVRQLMASRLNGSVLDFPCNLGGEISHWDVVMSKVRVVPGVALNANAPTLLSHAKHKSPTVLRIQVGIGQHKEALVLTQLNVLL